jgi:hypothetical protein
MHTGSCNCGAIRFEVQGELHKPDACHCQTCRRQSSHYFVSTDLQRTALTIHGSEKITWYRSSEKVQRGFCSICGCALFWDVTGRDKIAVGMGAFDSPTRTQLSLHIFVAEKGDYYEITDGLPQNQH